MKITVIVPVYNCEKFLDACISSIVNQTYKNLEILLVNDGSTDNSGEMCDKWASTDNRIAVFKKQNSGQADARNFAIEKATGDLIAFVDSDDYIEKDMYQALIDALKTNKSDCAMCAIKRVYENRDERPEPLESAVLNTKSQVISNIVMPMLYPLNGQKVITASACRTLFFKDIILSHNIRFPNEKQFLGEDLIFNLQYLLHAESAIILPDYFYAYRTNTASFTNVYNYSPNRLQSVFNMAQYIKNLLIKNDLLNNDSETRLHAKVLDSVSVCVKLAVLGLPKKEAKEQMKKAKNSECVKNALNSKAYKKCPAFLKLFSVLLNLKAFNILVLLIKIYFKAK